MKELERLAWALRKEFFDCGDYTDKSANYTESADFFLRLPETDQTL